jgi:DNA-binding response OmpR family regulator
VRKALLAQGHQVDVSGDGLEGEHRALTRDVDLVILDRMLPGREGVEVLRGIRAAKPDLPVIMLTALAEVGAKVEALDAGATDYMTKPFSVDELLARVRAHLRRPSQPDATRLSAAGIDVDLLSREVQRDEEAVRLSAKEFELLVHFMRHPNQVLSREQLLSGVWGYDFEPQTNVVEVYVGYLRKKLGRPDRPAPIDTIRSAGYRFTVR